MKDIFLLFGLLLVVVSCHKGESDGGQPSITSHPIAEQEAEEVTSGIRKLMELSDDPEAFSNEVERLSRVGNVLALKILVGALVKLPWEFDDFIDGMLLHDSGGHVPKMMIGETLSELIHVEDFRIRSVYYFRALEARADTTATAAELIKWVNENGSHLLYDGRTFRSESADPIEYRD